MSTMIMAGSQVRPGDTVLYLHYLQCVQVGTIVGFYISGLLYDWVGWEAVFYIQGGACLVWLLFWLLLTSDTPASHPSYGPRPSPPPPLVTCLTWCVQDLRQGEAVHRGGAAGHGQGLRGHPVEGDLDLDGVLGDPGGQLRKQLGLPPAADGAAAVPQRDIPRLHEHRHKAG